MRAAAKRETAAAYGSKRRINLALARLSKRFNSRGWVKAAAAKFFKKAFQHSGGRAVLMNFDVPDPNSIKNFYLQKTLLSIRKIAENGLANWFGIYTDFKYYPLNDMPLLWSRA